MNKPLNDKQQMKQAIKGILFGVCVFSVASVFTACKSDEDGVGTKETVVIGGEGSTIKITANEENFQSKPATRSFFPEPEERTVNLGNGLTADVSIEEEEEDASTRAPKALDGGGTYRIYAVNPITRQRIEGNHKMLKGTFSNGNFTCTEGRLILAPGTYKFVCISEGIEFEDYGTQKAISYGNLTNAMVGVTNEISLAATDLSLDVHFTMKHLCNRVRFKFRTYKQNIPGIKTRCHLPGAWIKGILHPDGTSLTLIDGTHFDYTFDIPATATANTETGFAPFTVTTDYQYLLPNPDTAGSYIEFIAGSIYGKPLTGEKISIKDLLNIYWQTNQTRTVVLSLTPNPIYLFSDGTVGMLEDKGSRTPIGVVVMNKKKGKQGKAVALKDCVNQWGNKGFVYGAWPPAGTRLFEKNNTSNYSDMASTLNDVDGYKWTWETAGSKDGTVKANDNNNYTCFYAAANYNPGVTPQNIGKWYLPATGEIKQLIACYGTPTITTINKYNVELKFDYINLINKAFTDAGGDAISASGPGYWTSSEVVLSGGGWSSNQTPVLYYDNIKKTYVVGQSSARHNNTCLIRPFVHF
ncbi:hypothetical protein [Hoylesella marshii]|uniref:Fibrobacter succinogene major paralogous domain protein n=1 Tax=Hoylesella marshii DSM 16973 = JCM 13450 TaxID=862515 RepID=E0NQ11_9BACT|nr:hypothetical protein [Hoylesella marshii]EFM02795.1 hypothetical protein HMPREF0658_0262 [Hoylesella marshii DSM 16973 = JCM 13450]